MSDTAPVYGIPSDALGAWADDLQPASWRGVPFAVKSETIRRGRRTAVHEYPYRDDVWVEDLGRGVRRISVVGFVLGDDVFDQRQALLDACETAGPGNLVHPSLGTLEVSLEGDVAAGTRPDLGRVVEIEFAFIETGQDQPLYPTTDVSTQDDANAAADACDIACASDFVADVTGALAFGASVVQGVVATVSGFVAVVVGTVQSAVMLAELAIALPGQIVGAVLSGVGQVIGLVDDAAIGASVALGLVGNFGRYAFGPLTVPLAVGATIASQIADLTVSRAAVDAAVQAALTTAAESPATLPAAMQAAVVALAAAMPNPADRLRLLAVLASYAPTPLPASAPIGSAIATAQNAVSALVRRAACAALVRAAAAYQPSSYDDAVARLDALTALLNTEATIAADAGDAASYAALRVLRTAVTTDLITRGATLPRLVTITRRRSQPSLVLAYELYGDATRSDDLIARADPINPMFLPTSFIALSN